MSPFRGGWVIWLSLLVALILSIAHLPTDWPVWLGWLRPNWVMLILFYWAIEHPQRLGPVGGWLVGLLLDALLAQPLGLNAMLLAAFVYLMVGLSDRLRMYSMAQQCLIVFLVALATEVLRSLVLGWVGGQNMSWGVLLIATMTMFCWPFIAELLIRTRALGRPE